MVVYNIDFNLLIHERNNVTYDLLQNITLNLTVSSVHQSQNGEEIVLGYVSGGATCFRRNSSGLYEKIQDLTEPGDQVEGVFIEKNN